jgi:hypothetical protein
VRSYLLELQQAIDSQDIGQLILLLKGMIPDYDPDLRLSVLASGVEREPESKIGIPA